jgi:hypothetical protein
VRMRGSRSPEAWACRLLAKLPVPERVGSKVLPIPTKSLVLRQVSKETVGEHQEPPRIQAGEVSVKTVYTELHKSRRKQECRGRQPFAGTRGGGNSNTSVLAISFSLRVGGRGRKTFAKP